MFECNVRVYVRKEGGWKGCGCFFMLLESKLNKQVFGGTSASCVGSQVLWSLGAQCVMEDALVYYCALFCGSADKQLLSVIELFENYAGRVFKGSLKISVNFSPRYRGIP